jgi:hypothetical protein
LPHWEEVLSLVSRLGCWHRSLELDSERHSPVSVSLERVPFWEAREALLSSPVEVS